MRSPIASGSEITEPSIERENQPTVLVVGAVGEELPDHFSPAVLGQSMCHRARQRHQGQLEPERHVDDGLGLVGVVDDPVVEGTVRLEVGDVGARLARDGLERLHLLGQVPDQVGVLDLDVRSAEVLPVAVRRLGTDLDAVRGRQRADRPHRLLVARMEPAGDVGLGHDLEQLGVGIESFADVGVQVVAHRHAAIVTRPRLGGAVTRSWRGLAPTVYPR